MLFHITSSHTPEHCAMYNPEIGQTYIRFLAESLPALAKEEGVTLHFSGVAMAEHTAYFIMESATLEPVQRLLFSLPLKQVYRITPITVPG
jgi:hypothetical protein